VQKSYSYNLATKAIIVGPCSCHIVDCTREAQKKCNVSPKNALPRVGLFVVIGSVIFLTCFIVDKLKLSIIDFMKQNGTYMKADLTLVVM